MNSRNIRIDRHTRSLLTDHMVFSPKFRGRVLVGEVRDYAEEVIRGVCAEMGVEVIRMSVSSDHVHMFYRYPPRYSVSGIANRVKGRSSRLLRARFPHLSEWCSGALWAPSCFHGSVGHGTDVVEKYISTQRDYNAGARAAALRDPKRRGPKKKPRLKRPRT